MTEPHVADYFEDLSWSHRMHALPIWSQTYKKTFGKDCELSKPHTMPGVHQAAGLDRTIVLAHGKTIKIDEKARRPKERGEWPYKDILLKYVSNDRTKALGWVCKPLLADYIAYAILQTGQCFLLPVVPLQAAWETHRELWLRAWGKRRALNHGYITLNCPVPYKILYDAIGKWHRVQCEPMTWEQLRLFEGAR